MDSAQQALQRLIDGLRRKGIEVADLRPTVELPPLRAEAPPARTVTQQVRAETRERAHAEAVRFLAAHLGSLERLLEFDGPLYDPTVCEQMERLLKGADEALLVIAQARWKAEEAGRVVAGLDPRD